jgi:rod shape-determining protein MreC
VLQLLKRYRELLAAAVALVLPLLVWMAHARHPGERSAVDRAIVRMSRPAERLVDWAVTGALGAWDGYLALRGAHERAAALSAEVRRGAVVRMELAELRAENERLGKLLSFARRAGDRPALGARVVGVRLEPRGLQLLTVDRGGDDGLARMMPVVAAEGVVGRVHAVLAGTAEVLLLTDSNSVVAARVERSRARANVRGTGETGRCRLDYALRADDLLEGDLLVTSGTDGVFPRGLPVGRIRELRRSAQGLYQKADVTPAVDVTKLEEVLVLTSGPEAAAASPRPSP